MEVRLYDDDIIKIISEYFKVPKENIDVFEENGLSWYKMEVEKIKIIES